MRIALAQIDCRLGNLPANRETHRAALQQVQQSGGADLVVFPELSLTGYRLRSNIHRAMLDERQFSEWWQLLRESAQVSDETALVVGYVELTERAILHNSCALLRGAEKIFNHRKVYLPTYGMFEEERYMRAGNRFQICSLDMPGGQNWRIGILCCEDAWHNSAWAIMQSRGVDLVIIPSASPGRGVETARLGSHRSWHGILSTQAEMAGCWVAYCNRVGFEDDINFWGGSAIFAPSGEVAAEGPLMDNALISCEIEKRAITTARLATPIGGTEDWHLTLREIADAISLSEE